MTGRNDSQDVNLIKSVVHTATQAPRLWLGVPLGIGVIELAIFSVIMAALKFESIPFLLFHIIPIQLTRENPYWPSHMLETLKKFFSPNKNIHGKGVLTLTARYGSKGAPKQGVISKERTLGAELPYSRQIDGCTALTHAGDYTRTFALEGVPYRTLGNAEINDKTERLGLALNTLLATPYVCVWAHYRRKKSNVHHANLTYDNHFSTEFAKKYAAKFDKAGLMENHIYLSVVVRGAINGVDRAAIKLRQGNASEVKDSLSATKATLDSLCSTIKASLKGYSPRLLETKAETGVSELASFYSALLNGTDVVVGLRRESLSESIVKAHIHFGDEVIEIQHPSHSIYAGILAINAPYSCEQIDARLLEPLMSTKYEYLLSQSLTVRHTATAIKDFEDLLKKVLSTDGNEIYAAELKEVITLLQANKMRMGDHEFHLIIYGNTVKELSDNIADAVERLETKQVVLQRESKGELKANYLSILPANFRGQRIRAMPLSTKNFSCFFPMHNHPKGNPEGSQWGKPIVTLKTDAGTAYSFNFHVPTQVKPKAKNNEVADDAEAMFERDEGGELNIEVDLRLNKRAVGSCLIIGPTGSGKTVLSTMLKALARRESFSKDKPLRIFTFDYGYGEYIFIKAIGGTYYELNSGVPSGLNVFQWDETKPSNLSLMSELVCYAGQSLGYVMTAEDHKNVDKAIKSVITLPLVQRRFARVLDTLDSSKDDGIHAQLARWCEGAELGWVLDSETNTLDLSNCNDYGFNTSQFLKNETVRAPILRMIFEKILAEASGSPHIIYIAEAWTALRDEMMSKYVRDIGETVRKSNGIICLDTQNLSTLIDSSIGREMLNQYPTKMLLPNRDARRVEYCDYLGLSEAEFKCVAEAPPNSGLVFIKKGASGALVELDLSLMADEMAVLSGSDDNVAIARACIEQYGDKPELWLPFFQKRRY